MAETQGGGCIFQNVSGTASGGESRSAQGSVPQSAKCGQIAGKREVYSFKGNNGIMQGTDTYAMDPHLVS